MKSHCFLIIVILLTSCAQVPAAPNIPTLEINLPTPFKQNPVTEEITPTSFNTSGRILVSTSEAVYLANSNGMSPVLIHPIESPVPMMALSPDGANFAYFSGNFLYVKDILTGTVSVWNREMMGSIGGRLAWNPEGNKIALSCSTPSEPTGSLCLVDKSGNIEYLIKAENIADEVSPEYFIELHDWSRDGSKLIFLYYSPSEKGQKQDFSIYEYDVVSKTTQLILDGKKQNMIFQIRGVGISPDNKTLLISGMGENSLSQIFVLNMDTLSIAPLQLQQFPNASYANPVWSNDNCCYYVQVEQDGFHQHTLIADLTGSIMLILDIQGTVLQWIK